MTPAEIAALWKGSLPAIFSAEVGPYSGPTGADKKGRVHVYPMQRGDQFMFIVWRNDRSLLETDTVKCIRTGGLLKSKDFNAAAREAMDVLLREYPQSPYPPKRKSNGKSKK